jgi:predicted P-loop ATPase
MYRIYTQYYTDWYSVGKSNPIQDYMDGIYRQYWLIFEIFIGGKSNPIQDYMDSIHNTDWYLKYL